MPYPINQSWREQIELNWIGARVGLWDTALKFLSPGPRNDVTDHLEVIGGEPVGYLQVGPRIWSRDYQEQIQLVVRTGLELGASRLQVQCSNCSATLV